MKAGKKVGVFFLSLVVVVVDVVDDVDNDDLVVVVVVLILVLVLGLGLVLVWGEGGIYCNSFFLCLLFVFVSV